jgi:hypothetical protein
MMLLAISKHLAFIQFKDKHMTLTKVHNRMIDDSDVNPIDFGAVGDGVTDDTAAVTAAIATGKNVFVQLGKTFAITGNVTGFADNQKIYGGGAFKKLGTTQTPMFLLPDESDGVWFDGIEFDGTKASFSAGDPVPAILGYITYSLQVTNCYFHDIIDVGIKLRDGANLYASGNRFIDIGENGIELHNYDNDVRTGSAYTGTRPVVEGNHTITGNRFERITRYENPAGPLVDACGIIFVGDDGYPQKNIRITDNVIIDCLRYIWTENNGTTDKADNVIISNNTLHGGVNGGTADDIYSKNGIGIIGAKNVLVTNNTIKNVANTNPVGSDTSCITVSGTGNENIQITGNHCSDDSGLSDRTEYGIRVVNGSDLRIFNNYIAGTSTGSITVTEANTSNVTIYSNRNAEDEYSWTQIVPIYFIRENIPANGDQSTYVFGQTWETEAIIPADGRIVGVAVKLSAAISAGNLTVKSYSNGVERTNLQIVNSDFSGGTIAQKKIGASNGAQVNAGERYKVVLTTDAAFAPTTMDAIVTMFVDIAKKD